MSAFQATSVLLLRVGAGDPAAVPGVAQPVFWDEVGVSGPAAGSVLQSIPLPPACTLSFGSTAAWLYDQEGGPTTAEDRRSAVFPCVRGRGAPWPPGQRSVTPLPVGPG